MPAKPNSTNGRVTLAVLQNDIAHLTDEVRGYRAETKELVQDHEDRLRTLEGSNRQGLWRDLGVLFAAIGAGIAGVFVNKP